MVLLAGEPGPLMPACQEVFKGTGTTLLRWEHSGLLPVGPGDVPRCALVWIPPCGVAGGGAPTLGGLQAAISGTVWPLFDLLHRVHLETGSYPGRVVAVSSGFVDSWEPGADVAAAAMASLETLCKYTAARLGPAGVRVNVVRRPAGNLSPAAHRDVAGVIVALCSGWMDALNGQVLDADGGAGFSHDEPGNGCERE